MGNARNMRVLRFAQHGGFTLLGALGGLAVWLAAHVPV
jgi:hypothetical protein